MTREQLLPPEIVSRLPEYSEIANVRLDDLQIVCKWFYPDFGWTWYVLAHVEDDVYFVFVDGAEPELGDVSLDELLGTHGKLGCAIERDLYFKPQPLRPVYDEAMGRR